MKEKIEALIGERHIDISLRSQLIHAVPNEVGYILDIERLVAQQSVLVSQIGILEEETKKTLIERERWNTRFNAMFGELRTLYERHNKLVEEIEQKRENPVEATKAE